MERGRRLPRSAPRREAGRGPSGLPSRGREADLAAGEVEPSARQSLGLRGEGRAPRCRPAPLVLVPAVPAGRGAPSPTLGFLLAQKTAAPVLRPAGAGAPSARVRFPAGPPKRFSPEEPRAAAPAPACRRDRSAARERRVLEARRELKLWEELRAKKGVRRLGSLLGVRAVFLGETEAALPSPVKTNETSKRMVPWLDWAREPSGGTLGCCSLRSGGGKVSAFRDQLHLWCL